MKPTLLTHPFAGIMSDLSVLLVSGADATVFLQSQLTADIARLQPLEATNAGYCTSQGRLLATMWLINVTQSLPDPYDNILYAMIMPTERAAIMVDRLKKYIMRSKVSIVLSSYRVWGQFKPMGLLDNQEEYRNRLDTLTLSKKMVGPFIFSKHSYVDINEDSTRLWLLDGATTPPHGQENSTIANDWRRWSIQAFMPWVFNTTAEIFVPQMVGLDKIEGVSFKKGCYPGQEVVARLHYLGKSKRQLMRGRANATDCLFGDKTSSTLAGQDIVDAQNQPLGVVVQAALSEEAQSIWFLLSVKQAAKIGGDDDNAISENASSQKQEPDLSEAFLVADNKKQAIELMPL